MPMLEPESTTTHRSVKTPTPHVFIPQGDLEQTMSCYRLSLPANATVKTSHFLQEMK